MRSETYDAAVGFASGRKKSLSAGRLIVAKLNAELNAIVREPEMVKRLSAEAAEPVITTVEAFGKLIVNDLAKWARIAKEAGIRAE